MPLLNRFALRRMRSSRRYTVMIIIERDIRTWQLSSLPYNGAGAPPLRWVRAHRRFRKSLSKTGR